jgi:hypothetical protein
VRKILSFEISNRRRYHHLTHTGEGKVVEILNDKMLLVEVRGVRFPAYIDQIDFPYYHRFTKKQKPAPKQPVKKYIDDLPKEKDMSPSIGKDEGVWLSMVLNLPWMILMMKLSSSLNYISSIKMTQVIDLLISNSSLVKIHLT